MVIDNAFSIKPIQTGDDTVQSFECIGSIDAHSGPALNEIQILPKSTKVILNFSQVERVNSMGLSLLLKTFEKWESQHIQVEVNNLNRMISMLFKITGLGRFLPGLIAQASDVAAKNQASVDPAPPFQSNKTKDEERAPTSSANATLKFVANLQTGQQMSGWYLLNTYLQRRIERAIHLEQPDFGQEVANTSADLFFSKPFEALSMIHNHGYVPLLRPKSEADEVVILARSTDSREFTHFNKSKVSTASKNSFVYILGRSLCDESGLDSGTFDFVFAGNEIKALQMLIKKQVDLLFMLKKTYQGLSSLARSSTRLVDESETNFAFHLFCSAPYLTSAIHQSLSNTLLEMADDEKGKQVLDDIEIDGWCKPDEGELKMLELLFKRYGAA